MSHLIITLLNQVDTITNSFVFQGYQNLVAAYSPVIYTLIGLVVVIMGYGLVQGSLSFSVKEILSRALIIGFVIALAMNWGNFSSVIYDLFSKAPNQIASHILKSLPQADFSDQSSANAALEQAFDQGMGFGEATWEHGSALNFMPWVLSIIIFAAVIILVGLALIELVITKFGLAIFLVLAPLIIPCFLFKATKEIIFDGWLKHLVTFAFVPIFIYCAMALAFTLMASTVQDVQNAVNQNLVTLADLVPYILETVVAIGLLLKSSHMASSLAGGFTLKSSEWAKDKVAGGIEKFMQSKRNKS